MYAVSRSRCVLAVISQGFLDDDCCRFCFESTVRDGGVDVIYVLYGDVDIAALDNTSLPDDVCVAVHRSRRRFVAPLTEADSVDTVDAATPHSKAVEQFLLNVRLAIPTRRGVLAAEKQTNALLHEQQQA